MITIATPNSVSGINIGDALPQDISDLDDLISYKGQMAYFINLNILGLNIGL